MLAAPIRKGEPGKEEPNDSDLIFDFLQEYSTWYFSPLRIQRWGSRQHGFSDLRELSTTKIRAILEQAEKEDKVATKLSRKGNPIYRITEPPNEAVE